MIEIEYLGVFGVLLEGHGEGVGGVDGTAGGGAEEDADGSFACSAGYAVIVIGGGQKDQRVNGHFCHVWEGRGGGRGVIVFATAAAGYHGDFGLIGWIFCHLFRSLSSKFIFWVTSVEFQFDCNESRVHKTKQQTTNKQTANHGRRSAR